VSDFKEAEFRNQCQVLQEALERFRSKHGFGRAIAAPQIGIKKRFIALNLDGQSHIMVNPEITWTSPEKFTMWDDCMSFPDLLVKVQRYKSVSVHFQDENGVFQRWNELDLSTSELLQHEIDHLDGVLATDRSIGPMALLMREQFDNRPDYYASLVDYAPWRTKT
jgi:peptide deformylase